MSRMIFNQLFDDEFFVTREPFQKAKNPRILTALKEGQPNQTLSFPFFFLSLVNLKAE